MLVELGLVEQRLKAVHEVLDGATVVDVAERYGVVRQTVHTWLKNYSTNGMAGLVDKTSRPASCPHQMPGVIEARIVELRRAHPRWGPQRILDQLAHEGATGLPGRSSIYRCLVRHSLIDPQARKRRKSDYKRWERSRPMELWQMDVVGGVMLADGWKASLVSGIDDHSRFIVSAHVVRRATARPVADALAKAMRTWGVPEEILTDNGKVFTSRFGPGNSPVLFDRILSQNGIKHRLTAPYSPTTTGKVERWHKTLRQEFLTGKTFADINTAQLAVDAWVREYNEDRPHQGIGGNVPWERFRLSQTDQPVLQIVEAAERSEVLDRESGVVPVTRLVSANGTIGFGGQRYLTARWLSGETVEVLSDDGLVEIVFRGQVIATHARKHDPAKAPKLARSAPGRRARAATVGKPVTRLVDSRGAVSFAGTAYQAGHPYRGQTVEVAIVGGNVQLAINGKVIKTHPIRHDPAKEHGAFANPGGRPPKKRRSA
jgi:transposase InsO family protein